MKIIDETNLPDGVTTPATGASLSNAMLPIAMALCFIAAMLAGHFVRAVPGGPFISLFHDAVPLIAAMISIATAWRSFRTNNLFAKLVAAFIVLVSTILIANVLVSVGSFWVRPYARGVLIGW